MDSEALSPVPPAPAEAPLVTLLPAGNDQPSSRRRATNAQVFLGFFILWQLFFLCSSNFLLLADTIRDDEDYHEQLPGFWYRFVNRWLPRWMRNEGRRWMKQEGHVHDALKVIHGLTDRWEELSSQPQSWSLFAPTVGREVTFLAVELRWDRVKADHPRAREPAIPYAPELLLSENEPRDPTQFVRVGKFRLRKYESNLDVILTVKKNESRAERLERWRDRIHYRVERQWDTIPAYLKMRYRDYQAEHPDRPRPRQVILLVRQFTIPKPEEFDETWYQKPQTVPMARWQPGVHLASGYEIEVYNPVTERFESLAR